MIKMHIHNLLLLVSRNKTKISFCPTPFNYSNISFSTKSTESTESIDSVEFHSGKLECGTYGKCSANNNFN